MNELYRTRGLVIRESWDDGLEVETSFGGTTTTIKLDAFQTRDLLRALLRGSPSYTLALYGPPER